ncbi:unnamed protein product [Cyprideis torosa]|uniref:Uncharacterized protein n=1 Tax=Cyprideis torosa TaxID=163714 RepID=A0A7R8ZQV1_9CRUS|nr:unnamed protein product [Cyprideis torosa]CAG0902271.1 unnamed protein product [Cyprideis torosa]
MQQRLDETGVTANNASQIPQIVAPKGKTIGSNCQCDAECDFRIRESFCDGGRCSCLPGFKGFTGALECSKLRIGDRCGSDLDCSLAIANSICDNSGFCACPTGFAVTRNGCEESEDCSTAVANSECTGNRCVCQTDFVETADGECRGASSASCYYASEDDQTWQAARDICQARGMDLVSIHNSEEESFVAGVAEEISLIAKLPRAHQVPFNNTLCRLGKERERPCRLVRDSVDQIRPH